MIIEADQDGKIEMKIETEERPYGFNKQLDFKVKRTIKIGPLSPYEILKVEMIKGEIK